MPRGMRILLAVLLIAVVVLSVVAVYQQLVINDILTYMHGHSDVHNFKAGK